MCSAVPARQAVVLRCSMMSSGRVALVQNLMAAVRVERALLPWMIERVAGVLITCVLRKFRKMAIYFDARRRLALDGRHDQTHDETGGDSNGLYFLRHC